MKKGGKIIAILSVIAVLIYGISAVYLLIVHPTNIYVVKQGTLSEEDEEIGYIIRNEKVVKGEDYANGIYASIEQLLVLANMESYNSTLIEEGLSQKDRIIKLNEVAKFQMKVLLNNNIKLIK